MKRFNDYLKIIQEEKYIYDEKAAVDWKIPAIVGSAIVSNTAASVRDLAKKKGFEKISNIADKIRTKANSKFDEYIEEEEEVRNLLDKKSISFIDEDLSKITSFLNDYGANLPEIKVKYDEKNPSNYESSVLAKSRLLKNPTTSKRVFQQMIQRQTRIIEKFDQEKEYRDFLQEIKNKTPEFSIEFAEKKISNNIKIVLKLK
jgi:hypothetical protein